MMSDYKCLTRLYSAQRLEPDRTHAHQARGRTGGHKVIWQANIRTAPSAAKIAAHQARIAEQVFSSAITPRLQESENTALFGSAIEPAQRQKNGASDGSSLEEATVADGSFPGALVPDFFAVDDWRTHDAMPLDLWREYVQAAEAGAFDVGECCRCGDRCSKFRALCDYCDDRHAEGGAR